MKRDRQVRRNRPGRGRPDQDRDVAAGERRHARRQLRGARRGSAGTRRRSTATSDPRTRPRLRPARCGSGCTSAPASCPCRRGHARRTGPATARCPPDTAEVHRQVRVIPVAEHHQPLELVGHHVDEALGVGAAGAAEVGHRHVALLRRRARDRPSARSAGRGSRSRAHRASNPAIVRDLTTRSFRILLSAVPRWIWPLA